ncbi:MAG: calcineurin-like phosphoesterase family protein [Arenimonas sp.]|nr:calcineurin-like phosphoesterase family protein [Arenimonas sp.]
MSLRAISFFLLAFVAGAASAQQTACDGGSVFLDNNGNGIRDAGEAGLPGMRVSDGERIVLTDSAGGYRLATPSGQSTFLIKPAGYRASTRSDGLPDTWTNVQAQAGPTLRHGGVPVAPATCKDFGLARDSAGPTAPLSVLLLGDPQPKSLVDVDYYQRDIVAPLRGKSRAQLAISLGDIVNDDLSLYPALKAVDASLGIPWLHAAGNHDMDFDADSDARSLDSFRHAFGPDTHAWEEEQAGFIVLDDVVYQPGRTPVYVGGLREQQFAFLSAYLASVPKDRLLVIALHIPLFDVGGVETFRHADRQRLFALLQPFPNLLVLSGHTHNQQHFFHGPTTGWQGEKPLHEYNVGTASGAFWTGAKDADGIPSTTMSDGTPNGYAMLSVHDGEFDLRWFAAREPEGHQMALHAPKVLRKGAYPGFAVYANVFMGDASTQVEFRIDDGEWKPMRKVLQADPIVLDENSRDDSTDSLRGFDRLPEASASTHLWRGTLATDLDLGRHRVEVRANIAGFGLALAQTTYRLDEAKP